MKQKDVFLEGEGDAWFRRNHAFVNSAAYYRDDRIFEAVREVAGVRNASASSPALKLLEIGCGEARRLERFASELHIAPSGIEPSALAVATATRNGLDVRRGTAEDLPFPDHSFDIVVFGFCLYLCDPQDLFKIAAEADRVLKDESWIVICDFYVDGFTTREYHHREALLSHKMDFRKLFDWHPSYTCVSHRVGHHETHAFTDSRQDWVAVSTLRKAPPIDSR